MATPLPGDLHNTLMHCPQCQWHGLGKQARIVPDDVVRCPLCHAPTECTLLCGLPVRMVERLPPRTGRPEDN